MRDVTNAKNRVPPSTILTKLVLSFCASVFVPLLLVGFLNVVVVRRSVEAELSVAIQDATHQAQLTLSQIFDAMKSAYYLLNYPEPPFLDERLSQPGELTAETVRRLEEYDWVVAGIEAGFGIQRVRLYIDSPSPFLDNERFVPLNDFPGFAERVSGDLGGQNVSWIGPYTPVFNQSVSSSVFSLVGPIVRTGRYADALGYVVIDSSAIRVQRVLDDLAQQFSATVYLADSADDRVLLSSEPNQQDSPISVIEAAAKNTIVRTSRIDATQWDVVAVSSLGESQGSRVWSGRLLIIGFVFAAVSGAVWIAFLARSLSARLGAISNAVERSGLDKGEPVVSVPLGRAEGSRGDELDALLGAYNAMVDRVRYLVREVFRYESEMQIATISALQSQISSHFVFNTLEAISASSRTNQSQRTVEMTANLAMFIRATMSGTTQFSRLELELSMLAAYVDLVSVIYGLDIEYEVECPSDLLKEQVLRFVLQPLVENAITHGFRSVNRKHGRIVVAVSQVNGSLTISVEDDGAGVAPTALQHLRTSIEGVGPIDSDEPMGLRNIQRRIHLEFGETYGIQLESTDSGGTNVTACMPMTEGDQV